MASAIFNHTNGKIYHKILSKKVFNPGLNVYIFRSKLQLLKKVLTNPEVPEVKHSKLWTFRKFHAAGNHFGASASAGPDPGDEGEKNP